MIKVFLRYKTEAWALGGEKRVQEPWSTISGHNFGP